MSDFNMVVEIGLPDEMNLDTVLQLEGDVGAAISELLDKYEAYDGASLLTVETHSVVS